MDVFWFDVGVDVIEGWSFVGMGVFFVLLEDVDFVVVDDDFVLLLFWGGWVGWWDYESGVVVVGVLMRSDDLVLVLLWLCVMFVVVFDYVFGCVWVLNGIDDEGMWIVDVEEWSW